MTGKRGGKLPNTSQASGSQPTITDKATMLSDPLDEGGGQTNEETVATDDND